MTVVAGFDWNETLHASIQHARLALGAGVYRKTRGGCADGLVSLPVPSSTRAFWALFLFQASLLPRTSHM